MLASRHKDIHGSVSKVGKAIDRVSTHCSSMEYDMARRRPHHVWHAFCRTLMQRSVLWWQRMFGTPQRDRNTWARLLWSICTDKGCSAWQRIFVRWVTATGVVFFYFYGCMFDDYLLKRKWSNLVISLIGIWCSYRYEYEAAISGAEQNPWSSADAGPWASTRVCLYFISSKREKPFNQY